MQHHFAHGFDAYVINPRLQLDLLLQDESRKDIDIATDASVDDLIRLFNNALPSRDRTITAELEENGCHYRFYPTNLVKVRIRKPRWCASPTGFSTVLKGATAFHHAGLLLYAPHSGHV